jgi:predicted HTH domain antitoxin
MSKVNIQIEVPEELHGTELEEKFLSAAQELLQEQVVLRLFEKGEISSGYAAHLLGMSRYDFIELLGKRRIPLINYGSKEEVEQEFQVVDDLLNRTKQEERNAE